MTKIFLSQITVTYILEITSQTYFAFRNISYSILSVFPKPLIFFSVFHNGLLKQIIKCFLCGASATLI